MTCNPIRIDPASRQALRTHAIALIIVLLSLPTIVRAAPPVVHVDLGSATFRESLPFDQRFLVKGPRDAQVQMIEAWYRRTDEKRDEKKGKEKNEKKGEPQDGEKAAEDWELAGIWRSIPGVSSDATEFSITFPALKPNKWYEFKFEVTREPTEGEIEALRSRVYPALDGLLQDAQDDSAFRRVLVPRACEELFAILSEGRSAGATPVAIADKTTLKPGTLGTRADTSAVISKAFCNALEPQLERPLESILDIQEEIRQSGIGIEETIPRVERALNALREKSEDVRGLRQFIESMDRLSDHERGVAIPLETIGVLEAAGSGLVAGGRQSLMPGSSDAAAPEESIHSLWDPHELDLRTTNLKRSLAQTVALRGLLHGLTPDGRIRSPSDESRGAATEAASRSAARVDGDLRELQLSLAEAVTRFEVRGNLLRERQNMIAEATEEMGALAQYQILVQEDTYPDSLKLSANRHSNIEFGLAYSVRSEEALPYFGLNLYFVPVNRSVPLKPLWSKSWKPWDGDFPLWDLKRLSLTMGITKDSFDDGNGNRRRNLMANRGLLVGGGYRIMDFIRLSGGVLLFKENKAYPQGTDFEPTADGYAGLSLDADVKDVVGKAFDWIWGS
jgi:hypothetical protein